MAQAGSGAARSALLDRLAAGILLADGATGTMLVRPGEDLAALEHLNLVDPDRVAAVHAAYYAAGAEMVETNTLGGNPTKLAMAGLGDEVRRINVAGAATARRVAPVGAFVVGSMGPTGRLLEPLGNLSVAEAEDGFAIQADALAEGGADAIVVETMGDLAEARAAVRGAKRATGLPVICGLTFDSNLRTMMGVHPEDLLQLLDEGADVIGTNCGQGVAPVEAVIARLQAVAPGIKLIAKPNAGMPRLVGDRTVYDATPADLAEFGLRMKRSSVAIVGACCGSTPAHIAAMAEALRRPVRPGSADSVV